MQKEVREREWIFAHESDFGELIFIPISFFVADSIQFCPEIFAVFAFWFIIKSLRLHAAYVHAKLKPTIVGKIIMQWEIIGGFFLVSTSTDFWVSVSHSLNVYTHLT